MSLKLPKKTEIVLEVRQPPEVAGYNDTLLVIQDNHFVYSCPASGGPNRRQPWYRGGGPWYDAYGQIAASAGYVWECVQHYKYGKSVLLNGGGKVWSRVPNPNHDGEAYMTEVFIHKGWSNSWRGSAGCPVVHPVFWKGFQYFLEVGDTGSLVVLDV